MKILVTTSYVPFISGGAEAMAESLVAALKRAGHEAEILTMPFKHAPKEDVMSCIESWQGLSLEYFDMGQIDRVICLKFPSYCAYHPNKSIWLCHQHRSVYELFDTSFGENSTEEGSVEFRDAIIKLDSNYIGSAQNIFTISKTVSDRLLKYNGVESLPLYQPPPNFENFEEGKIFPFIYVPSRLETLKRQDLLIRAMEYVKEPIYAIISGNGGKSNDYKKLTKELNLEHRIKFVGTVDEEVKRSYYSNCLAVYFGPFAEDYGFITLEAMLSGKPVITCIDSGGPLEFVVNNETGNIVEPDPVQIADSINTLWSNKKRAFELGKNAKSHYKSLGIDWMNIVDTLV